VLLHDPASAVALQPPYYFRNVGHDDRSIGVLVRQDFREVPVEGRDFHECHGTDSTQLDELERAPKAALDELAIVSARISPDSRNPVLNSA
jgi:hypothetical protein